MTAVDESLYISFMTTQVFFHINEHEKAAELD